MEYLRGYQTREEALEDLEDDRWVLKWRRRTQAALILTTGLATIISAESFTTTLSILDKHGAATEPRLIISGLAAIGLSAFATLTLLRGGAETRHEIEDVDSSIRSAQE